MTHYIIIQPFDINDCSMFLPFLYLKHLVKLELSKNALTGHQYISIVSQLTFSQIWQICIDRFGRKYKTEIKYFIFLFDKSLIIQDFLAVFLMLLEREFKENCKISLRNLAKMFVKPFWMFFLKIFRETLNKKMVEISSMSNNGFT